MAEKAKRRHGGVQVRARPCRCIPWTARMRWHMA